MFCLRIPSYKLNKNGLFFLCFHIFEVMGRNDCAILGRIVKNSTQKQNIKLRNEFMTIF
jgi:hypothetical protein